MSGSATFTTVMSSSNMKVARQTASRLHHLRSIPPPYRRDPDSKMQSAKAITRASRTSPDAPVEAPARQLGETADRLREANLELITRRQLPRRLAVERDLDR